MKKEFNLSEKLFIAYGHLWLHPNDVKEFITRLREQLNHYFQKEDYKSDEDVNEIINKLAGEELI